MNLDDEAWRYADYLLASDFRAVFAALGVDPAATEWQGYLGLMRVGLDASTGLWEPQEDGLRALTVPDWRPAAGGGSACVDILAIGVTIEVYLRRSGLMAWVGELDPPRVGKGPVTVPLWRTPRGWLRHIRTETFGGIAVLDWSRMLPSDLAGKQLVAEDAAHAGEIKRHLDAVWRRGRIARPKIFTRKLKPVEPATDAMGARGKRQVSPAPDDAGAAF